MSELNKEWPCHAELNIMTSCRDAEALEREIQAHPEEYASYGAELEQAALHLLRASSLVKEQRGTTHGS